MAELVEHPVDPALTRWLVLTDDREEAAALAVATAAASLLTTYGPPSLTWMGTGDDWRAALASHDLVLDLVSATPQAQGAPRWHHVLEAGRSVLVRTAGDVALREPVALGVAGRLPLVTSADDVLAATRRLVEKAADAPREVARSWVARPARREETAPRVLVLAVTRTAASLAAGTSRAVAGEGGSTVVATHSGVRESIAALPASARVVEVPDPVAGWWLCRAELLLLHSLPRGLTRVERALARRIVKVLGTSSAHAVRVATSLDRAHARRTRAVEGVERRAWNPLLTRLRPWLFARALAPQLHVVGEVDLVVAADADATALVWRLLRADHDLESRSTLKRVALESVVRRRTVLWVQHHPISG